MLLEVVFKLTTFILLKDFKLGLFYFNGMGDRPEKDKLLKKKV